MSDNHDNEFENRFESEFEKETIEDVNDLPSEEVPVEEVPVEEEPVEVLDSEDLPEEIPEEEYPEEIMPEDSSYESFGEPDEGTVEAEEEVDEESEPVSLPLEDDEEPAKPKRVKYKKQTKKTVAEEILDWLKTICIGIIAGVFLVIFVIQRDDVYGRSMMPTLSSGDVVFTQKIATYFKSYERGDIVVLDGKGMVGYDKDEYLIKRIIGLPGETVRIADGNVYIKPKDSNEFFLLEESYLVPGTQTTVRSYGIEHGYDEVKLGEDEYYCMGDNRPESNDSRTLGVFTAKRIKGVAVIRLFPFNAIKLL